MYNNLVEKCRVRDSRRDFSPIKASFIDSSDSKLVVDLAYDSSTLIIVDPFSTAGVILDKNELKELIFILNNQLLELGNY